MAQSSKISVAQGFLLLAAVFFGYTALSHMAIIYSDLWRRAPSAQAICRAPVAIETPRGLRLGCADEAAVSTCHAKAFDRLRLASGHCARTAYGMPLAWFVPLGALLNINRAEVQHLQVLPNIGVQTARAIVAHRRRHGPFASVEALGAVHGVGRGKLAQLRRFVTVADAGWQTPAG